MVNGGETNMSQELTDGEFWLPPEFLNDEDVLMDFIPGKSNSSKNVSGFGYSGLSSPVESVIGSTETESDEDDYLNGLTRKFSHSTLQDDFWKFDFDNNYTNKCATVMAVSPESTLCGCKQGSSRGSPNCLSPPVNKSEPSMELLYAAAGEVARMRMLEEAANRFYKTQRRTQPPPPPPAANPNLHYQQLQVAQFQQLKQQQMLKQQYLQMIQQSRARNESGNVRVGSAWPTPQQSQNQRTTGSGMRAVFLGNPTTKRESTGTGVFLPRQIGAPTEPIKKRGCSTVLLPDRVVQALNLNLEAMETASKLRSRCNVSDHEMMYRNSLMMAQQKRNNQRQPPPAMSEFRLPQEWTY